ncbi:MAG: PAS domain S-box protein [Mariprofundus sp.]|nr:PAS domain S-box protein [Mariprofundus sp.]
MNHDKLDFSARYTALLAEYADSLEEAPLAEIEALGQEMVLSEVPPENIGEIHDRAITNLLSSTDISAQKIHIASTPLMALLMAYGVAFRALLAKKEAEARLHLASRAIENTIEGIIITGNKGAIIDVNRAFERVTGYSRKEALGNKPSMLHSGRQDADFYHTMWQTLLEDGQWQGKIWNKRKSGEVYPEHLSITAIHDDEGAVMNYVGVFSDITEQLSLEKQLLQAQKMEAIGTLVGGIAHDFNNMLAGITGNIYLAKKKAKGMTELTYKLDNIEQLSFRSADMISQLLTFARKGLVDMHDFSLQTFVKEALKLSKVSVPENINFHYEIADDTFMIHGDMTQLQQVIVNLLNNARDAVLDVPQPEIMLKLSSCTVDKHFREKHPQLLNSKLVCLSIRDNGSGIAKEHLHHLFEPFFTTKAVGKGTGLGLAMCYGALQSHQGVINVKSKMGVGSTFYIYLPLINNHRTSKDDLAEVEVEHANGETILLADDELNVRETTAEVLESMGYRVLQAKDGLAAVELFKTHHSEIAIAILDVVMPHLGGIPLAKRLRVIAHDIPLIFITGYDRDHTLGNSTNMHHSETLTKPVNFDLLNHSIRQLLD